MTDFDEKGSSGLTAYSGFVSEAYNSELYWPGVWPLYSRLIRSCPEVVLTRRTMGTVASDVTIAFETVGDEPNDAEKRFAEFGNQVLDDLEGGIERWRDKFIARVPFAGWGWWEAVPGLRSPDWTPPGDDPWRSKYSDGLIGFRRLAFRDHSSFLRWDLEEKSGRLKGMWQLDPPNPQVLLPLANSVHCSFGDSDNPEGLTPLEAVWRLERLRYGFEVVMGIGSEHTAGHLRVAKTQPGDFSNGDLNKIAKAAYAVLSAKDGNYSVWPYGVDGNVIDVPFSAAPSVLEAIRHYSMLMMALYNMQFMAMSTMSDTGAYAALKDASALWMLDLNSTIANGVAQLDNQIGLRLLQMNAGAFAGVVNRPMLKATKVDKIIDLQEVASFVQAMNGILPMGDEDYLAIRKRSKFLPETLPEVVRNAPGAVGANGAIEPDATATEAAAQPAETGATEQAADTAVVQAVALNGAQVTAALEIVGQVARGELPYEQGVNALQIMFGMTEEQARQLLGDPSDAGKNAPPAAPTPAALALFAKRGWDAYAKVAVRFAELEAGGRGPIYAEMARGYDGTRRDYYSAVYDAVLGYLSSGGAVTAYKNSVKRALVGSYPDTFYLAYAAGGGEDVDREDDAWLTTRINADLAHVDSLFQSLKELRGGDEELTAAERKEEASTRAGNYAAGLDAIYTNGLLRGQKNIMLTMTGEDGATSCRDCRKNKGKRYSAKKWLRLGLPGVVGNGWECGGYQCQHKLIDDDGTVWNV